MGLIDSAVEVAASFSGHLTRTRTDNWPSRSGAWGTKSNWTTNYSDKTFLQISSATSVGQRRRGAKGKRGGLVQGHGSCLQVIGLWEVTNQTTENWIIFLLIRKAVNPFCGFCDFVAEIGKMIACGHQIGWIFESFQTGVCPPPYFGNYLAVFSSSKIPPKMHWEEIFGSNIARIANAVQCHN